MLYGGIQCSKFFHVDKQPIDGVAFLAQARFSSTEISDVVFLDVSVYEADLHKLCFISYTIYFVYTVAYYDTADARGGCGMSPRTITHLSGIVLTVPGVPSGTHEVVANAT